MLLTRLVRLATVRLILAALFVITGAYIVVRNYGEITANPVLGTDYVHDRRAELIRQIDGVPEPSKQNLMNLRLKDGMRFLAFARNHLAEESQLIFPKEAFNAAERGDVLGHIVWSVFKTTLYPRTIKIDAYDFRQPPVDSVTTFSTSDGGELFTRTYSHSSRLFVFNIAFSPDAATYRFFLVEQPIEGKSQYHTKRTYYFLPEGDSA